MLLGRENQPHKWGGNETCAESKCTARIMRNKVRMKWNRSWVWWSAVTRCP